MADVVKPPCDLNNTLGALLIGELFASAFWGVTSAQTYIYYQRYPNDPLSLKLIASLFSPTLLVINFHMGALFRHRVLDTFDACLTSHAIYHYLVTNYSNPVAIGIPLWWVAPVCISLDVLTRRFRSIFIHVAVTVRYSIFVLLDVVFNDLTPVRHGCDYTVVRMSRTCFHPPDSQLPPLVVGLIIAVQSFGLQDYTQISRLSTLLYLNFGTGVLGDLLVAIILCFYLFTSRTGFRRTDTLLNTLIAYVVATGVLTSVNAILGSVFYAFSTKPCTYTKVSVTPVYINSYLALLLDAIHLLERQNTDHGWLSLPRLNAREYLREKTEGIVSFRLSRLSDQHFTADFGTTHSSSNRTNKGVSLSLDRVPHRDIETCLASTRARAVQRSGIDKYSTSSTPPSDESSWWGPSTYEAEMAVRDDAQMGTKSDGHLPESQDD
ncbi:hypothetical protein HD554DRAFT_2039221 [Boletus coccyginus]|nr:hypothetical protein HD554DRAFT_2039221 [Boletus coccyginus]